jgi:hypothetical protein
LPDTFTPLNVDEIGRPGHKSVVRSVLANFGRYGNFASEYSAANLPEAERVEVSRRYKRVVEWQRRADVGANGMKKYYPVQAENLKINPKYYSARLHCLVLAHTPEWNERDAPVWNEDSQSVYFFMSDILGPTLGFNYDASLATSPGDFNLIVVWAFKNVEKIKQLYLQKMIQRI